MLILRWNSCLRNVVTLFQQIEKERAWRKEHGRPEGFETLNARKPIGGFVELVRWKVGASSTDFLEYSCRWG